jgi:hypothetical protein
MKNGHLLFLKEKEPPLLIEFGPKDEAAAVMPFGQLLDESTSSFKIKIKTVWRLPEEIEHAEGLCQIDSERFLVAEDTKDENETNVFEISIR